jgi:hypothetical protein
MLKYSERYASLSAAHMELFKLILGTNLVLLKLGLVFMKLVFLFQG